MQTGRRWQERAGNDQHGLQDCGEVQFWKPAGRKKVGTQAKGPPGMGSRARGRLFIDPEQGNWKRGVCRYRDGRAKGREAGSWARTPEPHGVGEHRSGIPEANPQTQRQPSPGRVEDYGPVSWVTYVQWNTLPRL